MAEIGFILARKLELLTQSANQTSKHQE